MKTHLDLETIAQCVRDAKKFDADDRILLWEKVKDRETEAIKAIRDHDYKVELMHNRRFAELAEIPYSSFDEHWDLVRAGFALYAMGSDRR